MIKSILKTAPEEAQWLLEQYDHSIKDCLNFLTQQFIIIQNRNQLLLTLSTVTLTITGFSGPLIAKSNLFSKLSLVTGLGLMVLSTVFLLATGMRLKWVSQFEGKTPLEMISKIIEYRDLKSGTYQWQLRGMIAGLCCYVASLISFLIVS